MTRMSEFRDSLSPVTGLIDHTEIIAIIPTGADGIVAVILRNGKEFEIGGYTPTEFADEIGLKFMPREGGK